MNIRSIYPTLKDDHLTRRSLFGGIITWFLHQNIIYALSSLSCKWNWFPFRLGGLAGYQVVQAIVTVIAVLLILYFIYMPWREWRKGQSEKPPENPEMLNDTEKDRHSLAAFIVMAMNSFFLLFMIASFVVIFSLNACVQA